MKIGQKIALVFIFSLVSLSLAGCREAKEGADVIADEVTGKNKIEKKIEAEKKINDAVNKLNEDQQKALEQIGK